MNKLNAVIIEDEIPAARLLHSMIASLRPEWDITILGGNVDESIEWFSKNIHPQIIFLDIQLTDGNAFDFLSVAHPKSAIIFTTAFDQYAIRAFTVNSIDYILKPVDEKRLEDTIVKYENWHQGNKSQTEESLQYILDTLNNKDRRFRTRFIIYRSDKFWSLMVSDIAYFYSENKITFAVTKKRQEYVIDLSLNKLMEQLDPELFFRANRQIIVGIDSIEHAEPFFNGKIALKIRPSFKSNITISEEKTTAFKIWLNY